MKPNLNKEVKAKLSYLFLTGYKPREIAQVLNIPLKPIQDYYKEWKKWYDSLTDMDKERVRRIYE